METNHELNKVISFEELVEHGLKYSTNIVNGMPWSWQINGSAITNENDSTYSIETAHEGTQRFEKGMSLLVLENGLRLFTNSSRDTHAPGGCPM